MADAPFGSRANTLVRPYLMKVDSEIELRGDNVSYNNGGLCPARPGSRQLSQLMY